MIDEALLAKIDGADYSTFEELIALGRQKSYVTIDDICAFFPAAEQDLDLQAEVFSVLVNAGIPYVRDAAWSEKHADKLAGAHADRLGGLEQDPRLEEDNLAHIDVNNGVELYLKEVGGIPLLTQEEEVVLAQQIEHGRLARAELALGPVSVTRRQELEHQVEAGWAAWEHLVTANSRLVIKIAKKYNNRGVPFQDLIQEGNIGLIRAVKKFDYRLGWKFGTYAHWWIRQAVTRAIADQARTIRIPVHRHDQIIKLWRAQRQLTQHLGTEPTVAELARELDLPPNMVENLIKVARQPLSLEMPVGFEEDLVLADFIEDQEALAPEDLATTNLLREHLEVVFKVLGPREVQILKLRHGMLDGRTYTLEEIGRKMGVTRERVRQIENQALIRLRHPAIQQQLRAYLGSE